MAAALKPTEVQLLGLLLLTGDDVRLHNGAAVSVYTFLLFLCFFYGQTSLSVLLPRSLFSLFAALIVHKREAKDARASGVAFDRRGSPFVSASAMADGLTAVVTHTPSYTLLVNLCVGKSVYFLFAEDLASFLSLHPSASHGA